MVETKTLESQRKGVWRMNHAPEPWKLVPMYHGVKPTPDAPGVLVAADDTFIAGYSSDEGQFELGDPNYRRIVTCVNFLKGFATDDLESVNNRLRREQVPESLGELLDARYRLRELLFQTGKHLP
jgi:hypothetical protein